MNTITTRITDTHVLRAQDLISKTLKLLWKRGRYLFSRDPALKAVAEVVLKAVEGSHNDIRKLAHPFVEFQHQDTGEMPTLCEAINVGLKRHSDMRYLRYELSKPMNSQTYANWSILFLDGNIAFDQVELGDDLSIPPKFEKRGPKDEMTWDFWLGTNEPWYNRWNWEQDCHSVESRVRWQIEHVWRIRETEPDPQMKRHALRWENTAMCALEAVHQTIKSLDEVKDINNFEALCQRLHELMIKHHLWGFDNKNPDRADAEGSPLPFEKLSDAMKENYVLIMLATLSAIGDYKITKKMQTVSASAA